MRLDTTGTPGPTVLPNITVYPDVKSIHLKGDTIGANQVYTSPIILANELNPVGLPSTALSLSHMIIAGPFTNVDKNNFTRYDCIFFTLTVDGNETLVPYLGAALHMSK